MSRLPLDGCSGPVVARGMCRRHYDRWYAANRHIAAQYRGRPDINVLAERIAVDDECWHWLGGQDGKGYGYFRGRRAHIAVYEHIDGPVPPGLQLDHLCRNRACVNPSHLEPVTPRENTLRGEGPGGHNARKTHCPKGHPYDEHNTWWRPRRNGWERHCRACNRARQWTLLDRVVASR